MLILPPPSSGKIILDCDEVLLRYFRPYGDFLTDNFGINLIGDEPASYDLLDWTGLQQSDIQRTIEAFNTTPGSGFERLPKIDGALELVAALRAMGYDLIVVTKCSDDHKTVAMRESNLDMRFGSGVFHDLICLPMLHSKREAFSRFGPSIVLDDDPGNIRVALDAGHRGVLIGASHNQTFIAGGADGMDLVRSLRDLRIAAPEKEDRFEL